MLQYPIQHPPLDISSRRQAHSRHPSLSAPNHNDDDHFRHSSSATQNPTSSSAKHRARLAPIFPAYAAFPHPHAVPISPTNYPPNVSNYSSSTSGSSPALSSATLSSVPSSPSLSSPSIPTKPIPRSPLVSAQTLRQLPLSSAPRSPAMLSRQISSVAPNARSPHPLKPNLPSLSRPATGDLHNRSGADSPSRTSVTSSTLAVDVLSPGDLVGEGIALQGDLVRRVPIVSACPQSPDEEPVSQFEVVRRLGTGSYAVVYLVREVLSGADDDGTRSRGSSFSGQQYVGRLDLDDASSEYGSMRDDQSSSRNRVYGREYAIKVLSKANLDEEALEAQLFEATLHQSLRRHPNIVTLYRSLETDAFLLLLLEFVPGEDLFYFLEQSRDHYSPQSYSLPSSPSADEVSPTSPSSSNGHTPPTPSLLSSLHPTHLLSQTRLRLIASMFGQMCDAVATCHEQTVFHRDIKPENFIVTDGWTEVPSNGLGFSYGVGEDNAETRKERKVVVKLTDFGLGTMDEESADMDCGSAPYMSFECRNNLHPTYSPRAADVWSLGIVLINMLYHYNPWTDTTENVCPSFQLYLQNPVNFFMTRFTGMTLPVAEFLATRVFCILQDPTDDSARITAREFGKWAKQLPSLLGSSAQGHGHQRNLSISSTVGYTLASVPQSRRPSLRSSALSPTTLDANRVSWALASTAASRSVSRSRGLSRVPSLINVMEVPSAVHEVNAEAHLVVDEPLHVESIAEEPPIEEGTDQPEMDSRSTSTQKRQRKRGARKGKGASATTAPSSAPSVADTLAQASQALAREISRTSRLSISAAGTPDEPIPPMPVMHAGAIAGYAQLTSGPISLSSPTPSLPAVASSSSLGSASHVHHQNHSTLSIPNSTSSVASSSSSPVITKKPSKWKLSFGKASSSANSSRPSIPDMPPPPTPPMSTTASNVANLLNGLSAPPKAPQPEVVGIPGNGARGRSGARSLAPSNASATWGPGGGSSAFGSTGPYAHGQHSNGSNASWHSSASHQQQYAPPSVNSSAPRAISPASARSNGRGSSIQSGGTGHHHNGGGRSGGSSIASNNWRNSMASATSVASSSGSSSFTRYSNGSVRSVSTNATSLSGNSVSSWRSGASGQSSRTGYEPGQLPPNVKLITGTPWELDQLPRQMHLNPQDVSFGAPPIRKRRGQPMSKPKDGVPSRLDTINESTWAQQKSPLSQRFDASTSTTDLSTSPTSPGGSVADDDGLSTSPRKVQKGQVNALAKMLLALKR